jgi:amino acid adenylation domain-containing protein
MANLSPEQRELLERRLRKRGVELSKALILPRRREGAVPLSFAQQRIWFHEQLEPGSAAYNLLNAVRLTGRLDIDALEKSFGEIVRRHEVLRTTFQQSGHEPSQVVSSPAALSIKTVDLSALADPEQQSRILQLIKEEGRRPFDLTRDLLLRFALLRLGEESHIGLLSVHHIAFDDWSLAILLRELATLYGAFAAGLRSPLPELPIQYADFAAWQREWLQGDVLEEQLAYWKKHLGDAPPRLNLPTDRPRPPKQTYRGAKCFALFPATLTSSLKDLSRRENVTLFMTLLAGLKTVLHRYAGQDGITVGTPIANRNRGEIEGLIGFFANTLVLYTDFSGNPTFRELLARVRQVALQAYTYQDLPFEKLVERLGVERDESTPPLFQVLLSFKNEPADVELPSLTLSALRVEPETAKFDLAVDIVELERGLSVGITYNTELFEAETVRRLLGHYLTLLECAAADPEQRVTGLRLLTEEEERRQVVEWNEVGGEYEWGGGVGEEIGRRAKECGGEVAVEWGGEAVTYEELNRSADRLARYLVRLGVGKEVRVGLYAERSIETCIALLGILKAGGTYVPLDPNYPRERLSFMAKDAGPAVVLVGGRLDGAVLDCSAKLVSLKEDWDAVMSEEEGDPLPGVTADDAAYVIYTSGSTGRPKGVVGLHRGILNRVAWMQELYPFEANEVCCQKTSLSFVDSVWETLGPLMSGAKLVVIHDETVRDARRLVHVLGKKGVTRVVLVPSLLRAVLDEHHDLGALLPRLKYCVSSGEALPVELARRFSAAMPHSKLLNLYGSSEVAADATWHEAGDGDAPTRVPIGRPIANTKSYILDTHLRLLPVGVTGELYIGGHGLARGYLGNPALTAANFIPNPFGDERGSRLYKTGDLARHLPDGTIEYVGRNDRQVKLRGYRIELGEIEAALEHHPSVREAVVITRQGTTGEKQLIAHLLLRPGQEINATALRTFSREKLPEYMVPAGFVLTDSVPLTPGGKIDRRALAELVTVEQRAESEAAPPRTQTQEMLAEIWRKLLKVETVGIYDNFFELGGHSLLATQVITKVRDAFEVNLPQRAMFDAPTIAGLSDLIARGRVGPESTELEEVLKEVEALTADEAHDALLRETGEGRL